MAATLFHYASCDTCRKASAWLEKRGVDFDAVDIVGSPPTAKVLETYWKRSGLPLQAFFNVAGESYRKGGFKDRLAGMTDAEKLAALAADGKLIKRPLFVTEGAVLVGFKEALWAQALGGTT